MLGYSRFLSFVWLLELVVFCIGIVRLRYVWLYRSNAPIRRH
jgi:hypothetical protein